MMKRILHVVGARPNFMKMAPIIHALLRYPQEFEQILVHTGQHYDEKMSGIFFDELGMPQPDINLEVGSGSHAWQTAEIMKRFEPILLEFKPDWLLAPGDVNSTMACALVASKLGVKVAHIEAGLRSFDRTMPEEINRIVTDHLSDLLFTPDRNADENLAREGITPDKIRFVGNVMIDTLVRLLPKAEDAWPLLRERIGTDDYLLVTLHRPSNVDEIDTLAEITGALIEISQNHRIIFPVHPRTRQRIEGHNLLPPGDNLQLFAPLGYLDFLALQAHAQLVITDSGGVQEETTYLGVPCLTVRPNTERPVTISQGTNRLVASQRGRLIDAALSALNERGATSAAHTTPEYWDGQTAQRIVTSLREETI
jgi:UDP-N-acetylglucosamine 2-epimerase (non-hydrolysing)